MTTAGGEYDPEQDPDADPENLNPERPRPSQAEGADEDEETA